MKDTGRLLEYLRGDRRGKTANRLEREVLSDPFLYEALEGLETLEEDGGKVKERLSRLIRRRIRPSRYFFSYRWTVAGIAVLLVIGSLVGWRMLKTPVGIPESESLPVISAPGKMEDPLVRQDDTSTTVMSEKPTVQRQLTPSTPKRPQPDSSVLTTRHPENTAPLGKEDAGIQVKIENPDSSASFPIGGIEAYDRYIRKALVYPEDALKERLQGNIRLSFIVNKKGRPSRIRVVKWINHSCNHEAIRLLDEGPAWTYTGSDEPTFLTIPFRLPAGR